MQQPLIDMGGALTVEDMARLLKVSPALIRRLLKAERFPIPPMPEIDRKPRWWGPSVREWCERRAYGIPVDDATTTLAEAAQINPTTDEV